MDSREHEWRELCQRIEEIEKNVIATKCLIENKFDLPGNSSTLLNSNKPASEKLIYNNKTLSEELGISQKTLKKYRDEGLINFSQLYDKFFYTSADVRDFLAKRRTDYP